MRRLLFYLAVLIALIAAVPATDYDAPESVKTDDDAAAALSDTRRKDWSFSRHKSWAQSSRKHDEQNINQTGLETRDDSNPSSLLTFRNAPPHQVVSRGTELRILPLGDSITVGYFSETDGGNGDGYRRQLKQDLSRNKVVYAGNLRSGTMKDGYYAAWSGKTIQYIFDHADEALAQRPNVVLLMAGTNDMNPDPNISRQGNEPAKAAERLGQLVDKIVKACPDAVVLVAVIPGTCNGNQAPRTKVFQGLIPAVVEKRREAGQHVLAADFGSFGLDLLRDCIHPTNKGYGIMGDYWYDFMHQVPDGWIQEPEGKDPVRLGESSASRAVLGWVMILLIIICI